MRRTDQIIGGLNRVGRRPRPLTSRPERGPMSRRWPSEDPLESAPRITVGPAVVEDLKALRAGERPVVLSDGEQDLVVMVSVEQYRAQLLALARQRTEESNAQALSATQKAVLDPDELDALLADWDHSRGPRPAGPPGLEKGRSVRISDPPGRRGSRRSR